MPADAWGIYARYLDTRGQVRETSAETRQAILAAMGGGPGQAGPPPGPGVRVLTPGRSRRLAGPAELQLEDGSRLEVRRALPPDLPLGYHRLFPLGGGPPTLLIVAPTRCYLPPGARAWGWAAQLYAARSARSWGMGDLADLRRLARWSAGLGAGFILLNPLNAPTPVPPIEPSPYRPTSRRFRSPLYLRLEDVPGADEAQTELAPLAAAGRALNARRRIERDAIFRLKLEALERLWVRFRGGSASSGQHQARFERFRAEQGQALEQFATFCALAERYGPDWRAWPEAYRRPDAPAVARFAAEHAERLRFHQWQQWLLDEQLARAAAELPLLHDLPIGFDPGGADAWAWQDLLAGAVSVGAPPDEFNPLGQDWHLPPFVPHRLRAAGYAPFIQTLRAALRHASGLRIDHVMGLFRLFWIPAGFEPARGAYVRYPADELLAIVALESWRARATIIGEDLGTVEAGVRERMRRLRMPGCRLLSFERRPPSRYPRLSIAAITTHDLPTIAGLWSSADLGEQRRLGLQPSEPGMRELVRRLARLAGVDPRADVRQAIVAAHRALARAPSLFVTATLEDALAVEERPNVPGTVTERPNWSLALPVPLEELEQEPLALEVARALRHREPGEAAHDGMPRDAFRAPPGRG